MFTEDQLEWFKTGMLSPSDMSEFLEFPMLEKSSIVAPTFLIEKIERVFNYRLTSFSDQRVFYEAFGKGESRWPMESVDFINSWFQIDNFCKSVRDYTIEYFKSTLSAFENLNYSEQRYKLGIFGTIVDNTVSSMLDSRKYELEYFHSIFRFIRISSRFISEASNEYLKNLGIENLANELYESYGKFGLYSISSKIFGSEWTKIALDHAMVDDNATLAAMKTNVLWEAKMNDLENISSDTAFAIFGEF